MCAFCFGYDFGYRKKHRAVCIALWLYRIWLAFLIVWFYSFVYVIEAPAWRIAPINDTLLQEVIDANPAVGVPSPFTYGGARVRAGVGEDYKMPMEHIVVAINASTGYLAGCTILFFMFCK